MGATTLCMSSGGTWAVYHAALLGELCKSSEGRALLNRTQHVAGASAGAVVAVMFSTECDMDGACDVMCKGGLVPGSCVMACNALLTFMGCRRGVLTGIRMEHKLKDYIHDRPLRIPMTVAVTDADTCTQKCIRYTAADPVHDAINCAVASASVPVVFQSRRVRKMGNRNAYDGGVFCSFPLDVIRNFSSGTLVLLHVHPWPSKDNMERMRRGEIDLHKKTSNRIMYTFMLERHVHEFEPIHDLFETGTVRYDPSGVFRRRYVRTKEGKFAERDDGDLEIIFIAPAVEDVLAMGGEKSYGEFANTRLFRRLRYQGRDTASRVIRMLNDGCRLTF